MDADGKKECEINVELIKRAVSSVENISSNLKFVSILASCPSLGAFNRTPYHQCATSAASYGTTTYLLPFSKQVVLPSGTKAYGVHLIEKFPFPKDVPLKESLPRIPEPYASEMFYYSQMDMLAEMSKGKGWTWCDVVPDVVVGFVPNNNIYCLA